MSRETDQATTMRAMVQRRYGPLSKVVEPSVVPKPQPGDDQVLIRVHASSVNAMEWHLMTGVPLLFRPVFGLRKPKHEIYGADVAGVVEAVGNDVTNYQPGDAVFGEIFTGAYAEYAVARDKNIAHKPDGVSFDEAAAVGVAGLTALQFLRDIAAVKPGEKVLINGASGGVGTYAVQIAKLFGADVTAVCSTRNLEQAKGLGADRVIDYTATDPLESGERYDVILDIGGTSSLRRTMRALTENGRYLLVGGSKNRWVGPIPRLLAGLIVSLFSSKSVRTYTAESKADDLAHLGDLLASGAIKSVIAARYPLEDVAIPLERQGSFHAAGKTVITVAGP